MKIGPVCSALSSFAAQIIGNQLVEEAKAVVQDTSGQYTSITSKTKGPSLQWGDIGATLILTVKTALQTHQPLAFYYMHKVVEPKPCW